MRWVKRTLMLTLILVPGLVSAETMIAICGALDGETYVHDDWPEFFDDDEIKPGWHDASKWQLKWYEWYKDEPVVVETKVIKDGDEFNILSSYTSAIGNEVVEAHQITPIILDEDSFILRVKWPKGIHVYSFWENNDGRYEYSLSEIFPHSSSLLVGDCRYMDFGWMHEYENERE